MGNLHAELEIVFLSSTDVMAIQTVPITVTKRIALVLERTTVSNAMTGNAFSTSLNAMMRMIVMTEVMKRIAHQENKKESRKETKSYDYFLYRRRKESTASLYQNGI